MAGLSRELLGDFAADPRLDDEGQHGHEAREHEDGTERWGTETMAEVVIHEPTAGSGEGSETQKFPDTS